MGSGGRFPLLVADIAGTNARFGWVGQAGAPISDVASLPCSDYPGPELAARSYLDTFRSILGCVAGNLALTAGARGGVFVAGGIVPRLGAFFAQSAFREQFEAKGRHEEYLRSIATAVITAPNPGLLGMARRAATQWR